MGGEFYVYILFRPWNGVPCYVGKGKDARCFEHHRLGDKHHNKHLAKIFSKANEELPVVIIRSNLDQAAAFEIERALISAIGRRDKKEGPLANHTDGGEGSGGFIHTEEFKKQVSEKHRGKTFSPKSRRLLSIAHKGKTIPQVMRDRISATLTGRPISEEHAKKMHDAWRGSKHTPESIEKMSKAKKGKTFTAEHCQKLRDARKKQVRLPLSLAHKEKLSAARKQYWATRSDEQLAVTSARMRESQLKFRAAEKETIRLQTAVSLS